MSLLKYKQLDQLVLDEVNVKELHHRIMDTDKGEMLLVFDGEYRYTLGGKEVSTPRLTSLMPKLLKEIYKV